MKIPEQMRTYCPRCKKYQVMKVSIEKTRQRKGGKSKGARRQERHARGYGNMGRYSKRPVASRNMRIKTSKKTDLRLKCPECSRKLIRARPRAKRVEMVRK
jgi:ribosomal protein L44E